MNRLLVFFLFCSITSPSFAQITVPDTLDQGVTAACYFSADLLKRGKRISTTRFDESQNTLGFFQDAYERSQDVFVDLFNIKAGDVTLMKTEYVLKTRLNLQSPYHGMVVTMMKEGEEDRRLELLFEMAPNTEALLLRLNLKEKNKTSSTWVCDEYYERK